MRDREGKLTPRRVRKNEHFRTKVKGFGPVGYMTRDIWRNRSRTILAMAGIASLTLLFVLFTSMDRGLEEFFEDESAGVPSEEEKDLFEVKEVMDNWTYLITIICGILMVLVVANTSIITVVERKYELASLRALGISSFQVSMLVIGSMLVIVAGGLISGLALGLLFIPLLDSANLSILGQGIGLPFEMDLTTVLYVIGLGSLSSLIGLSPPIMMINRQSPLEVLRNA